MGSMNYKYAAAIVAIKNDFCLEESVVELKKQGIGRVLIVSPSAYWTDHTLQAQSDFTELSRIAQRMGAELVSANFSASERDNRALYTEALYRNYAIGKLMEDPSLDYALTVDADEFWLPGTLAHIDALAGPAPLTICLPGTPV